MDIRNTGVLDDFSTYPVTENETVPIGEASPVDPWHTSPGSQPIDVSSGGIGGTNFPPVSNLGVFLGASFYGATVEMWADMDGSPALSDAWRYGMYTVESVVLGAVDGYQGLMGQGVSGNFWILRRVDNGVATDIGLTPGSTDLTAGLALMRRYGNDVEMWHSTDGGASWTLRVTATDPTYINGPWFFVLGTTGVETGWSALGGGVKNRQVIYRVLKGLRV